MVGGPSTVELLLRLGFSLAIIVGILFVVAKVARKQGGNLRLPGLGGLGGRSKSIRVIDRQTLSRNASVAVVQIGARTMAVGITEHGIQTLAEGDDLVVLPPDADVRAERGSPATDSTQAAAPPVAARLNQRETKRTLSLRLPTASHAAADAGPSTRTSFIEALRELTIRS
jgi:flagellar biogenesis protein FliO